MTLREITFTLVRRARATAVVTAAVLAGSGLAASALAQIAPATTRPTSRPARPPTSQPATPGHRPLDTALALVRDIETAHGARAWRTVEAVRATLVVRFGGQERLRGTMLYEPHGGRVRLELADGGPVLVFDGQKAWCDPSAALPPGPRFHLLTWPYFLAAPFKLRDPGTHLVAGRLLGVDGRLCRTARLTFDAGVGDTPEDWYHVYAGPEHDRLVAMAYIVTYGNDAETAGAEPHAIVYDGFRTIDGVTLSTAWTFYAWNERDGIHGDPIGDATLTDVEFVVPGDDDFVRPAGTVESGPPA